MSDFQAIGGVSETLQALLKDRMELPFGVTSVQVTVGTPRPEHEDDRAAEDARVNLFLYQITENSYLKNQEIPGQGHPGAFGQPPLSLDLHYLLTGYGSRTDQGETLNETLAHFVLGSAMRVLHDNPVITGELKTEDDRSILHEGLHSEFEQVKLYLDPVSLEDLSKVWTALTQPYRLSAAYKVTVVQIESQRARRMAMPVKTRRIHMVMSRRPQIEAVYRTPTLPNEPTGDARVRLGQELTIEGKNFTASKTWVRLGNLEPIRVKPVSDDEIQMAVPDDEYPTDADHPLPRPIPVERRLQPGPQVVEVLTERETEVVRGGLDKGEVDTAQKALRSDQAVFMLVPEISPPITPTSGTASTLLTLKGKRLYKEGLKSFVLVGDVAIEARKPGPGDIWAEPEDTQVQVPLTALSTAVPPMAPHTYPVRILVNGAQSTEEGITFTLTP